MAEIHKILPIIEKYLDGKVMDIGCGDQTVIDGAFGVDGREFPCVSFRTNTLYGLPGKLIDKIEYFDTLVSSHTLEHLPDIYCAIKEWSAFIKNGGYLILYLPDGDYYNNKENLEHFHDTKYDSFLFFFKRAFCGEAKTFTGEFYSKPIYELVDSGKDIGEDRYSFYVIAKKI